MKKNDNPEFTLEYQWALFVKQTGIDKIPIPADIFQSLKDCFVGGVGSTMVLFDGCTLTQEELESAARNLFRECAEYMGDRVTRNAKEEADFQRLKKEAQTMFQGKLKAGKLDKKDIN